MSLIVIMNIINKDTCTCIMILREVLSSKFIADSAKKLDCACAVVYSTDSPSSFQFAILSGFVRFRTKGIRISEVLL